MPCGTSRSDNFENWRSGQEYCCVEEAKSNQSVALPLFWQITVGSDDCENLFRIPSQKISNGMGAFDHEGAILCTYASIKEEFTNVRPLRARQEGK